MIRRSSVVASIAAAALLLAACGNGDEGGVQELDPLEGNGQTDADGEPDDDGSDGPEDDANGQDSDDTNGAGQDTNGDEPNDDDQDANGSDEDAFAVPDEIDIDYVQSVFDELTHIDSESISRILARETPDHVHSEDTATLEAIYGGEILEIERDLMVDLIVDPDEREAYLPPDEIGEHRFEVMEIHSATDSCIAALGWWDLTEFSVDPFDEDTYAAYVLSRVEVDEDINPTGWVFWDRNPLVEAGGGPVPPEQWDAIDLNAVADVDCGGNE